MLIFFLQKVTAAYYIYWKQVKKLYDLKYLLKCPMENIFDIASVQCCRKFFGKYPNSGVKNLHHFWHTMSSDPDTVFPLSEAALI